MDGEANVLTVKRIRWCGQRVKIVMQGANGPCPLIALANCLLLAARLSLPTGIEQITIARLISLVGEFVLEESMRLSSASAGELSAEQAHGVNEALASLPSLQFGMDVNVRFGPAPNSFELSAHHVIFDLLGIDLVHGWLIDPQDSATASVILRHSYNSLVVAALGAADIDNGPAPGPERVHESLVAQQWLADSASQLTAHGLVELHGFLSEGRCAVLFRNNHFSCVVRRDGRLFALVTDVAFAERRAIVWESVEGLDGDVRYFNGDFVPYEDAMEQPELWERVQAERAADAQARQERQSQADSELARQLQAVEEHEAQRHSTVPAPAPAPTPARQPRAGPREGPPGVQTEPSARDRAPRSAAAAVEPADKNSKKKSCVQS